jgi:hypothetical protein
MPPVPERTEAPPAAPARAAAGTPAPTARVPAPKPEARSAAPPSNTRCSELLQRVQLGETLSPEGLEIFQKECRR